MCVLWGKVARLKDRKIQNSQETVSSSGRQLLCTAKDCTEYTTDVVYGDGKNRPAKFLYCSTISVRCYCGCGNIVTTAGHTLAGIAINRESRSSGSHCTRAVGVPLCCCP